MAETPKESSGRLESGEGAASHNKVKSWWKGRTTMEKGLTAGVVSLAVLCLVLLVLLLCGTRKIGSDTVTDCMSTEVCNTPACAEKADAILASIDESLDPCDDFYQFACQKWERNNPIPEDLTRYSSFDQLHAKLMEDLKFIFENTPYKIHQQNISDKVILSYHSCLNNTQSEKAQGAMLRRLLFSVGVPDWPLRESPRISGILDYDCFEKLYTKTSGSAIFLVGVTQDAKNVTNYVLVIDQPEFGLERHLLLTASSPQSQPIVQAYKTFIGESIKVVDPRIRHNELQTIVDNIFDFEVQLAMRTRSAEARRDITSMYNEKSIGQLRAEVPGVDWLRLFNGILRSVNITLDYSETIVVKEPEYVMSTAQFLKGVDKATVYNYMGWRLIQRLGPSVSAKLNELDFDFQRVARGVQKNLPQWKECIDAINSIADTAVGRLYVDHKFSPEAKEDMEHLVSELQESFGLLLKESQWMDMETKERAFKKLRKMTTLIGYPDWLTNNTALNERYALVGDIKPDSPFMDILLEFIQAEVSLLLRKLRTQQNNTNEWPVSPAVVNAAYNPQGNSIIFPAAILQSPHYTYGLPSNINMGGIGYTIGHEITHGFDDAGRIFDEEGTLRDWWTNETKAEFLKKAQCFVDQYGNTLDTQTNLMLNGVNTLGENIADNGAIREAFRAQRIAVAKTGSLTAPALPGLEKYTSDQIFFLSVAMVWCTSSRIEAQKLNLQTDTHSPSKYRINIPMANFEEFAKAFHCPKGSRMNPKDRCVLW